MAVTSVIATLAVVGPRTSHADRDRGMEALEQIAILERDNADAAGRLAALEQRLAELELADKDKAKPPAEKAEHERVQAEKEFRRRVLKAIAPELLGIDRRLSELPKSMVSKTTYAAHKHGYDAPSQGWTNAATFKRLLDTCDDCMFSVRGQPSGSGGSSTRDTTTPRSSR
jgi:hypothetical protein